MENNEIVLFETKDKEISLTVAVDKETVWLSANQMAWDLGPRQPSPSGACVRSALKEPRMSWACRAGVPQRREVKGRRWGGGRSQLLPPVAVCGHLCFG